MKNLLPSEVDIPTYDFGVHKTIGILTYRVMIRVHYISRNGIGHFYYHSLQQQLYNGLPSYLKGDCMQMLPLSNVQDTTYMKALCRTFSLLFFSIRTFKQSLNDPNEDCMKTLLPWEVYVPTYHFEVEKTIFTHHS